MKKNQQSIEQKVQETLDLLDTERYQSNPFLHTRIKQQLANRATVKVIPLFSIPVLLKMTAVAALIFINVSLLSSTQTSTNNSFAQEYGWALETSSSYISID